MSKYIQIRGAYENNLKHVDVDISLYESTVVVGVSGSGKSSLVYDTLYNESQRIFLENLSLNSINISVSSPSKVKSINNLPAAFSVSQQSYNQNPRSTIGTFTNISDYIRAIFSFVLRSEYSISLKPNDFSFNNPKSSCNLCKGIGEFYDIDLSYIIPDEKKTLNQHAIQWFKGQEKSLEFQTLKEYCGLENIPMDISFNQLSERHKNLLLFDNSQVELKVKYKTLKNRYKTSLLMFKGAITHLEGLIEDIETPSTYRKIQRYLKKTTCKKCTGLRLNKELLSYKVNDLNISEVELLNMKDLINWIDNTEKKYFKEEQIVGITKKVKGKVDEIIKLSLQYLSLDRSIPTLSGGELQRIRIANQLDNPLTGLLYIFDEPCKGLHVKDIDKIILAANVLLKKGNTLVAIEHNKKFIAAMENVIYLGPEAGKKGGQIITEKQYAGNNHHKSESPLNIESTEFIQLKDVSFNNLKNLELEIPIGGITAFTGVSGSGKSSMMTVLEKSLINKRPIYCSNIMGDMNIKKVHRLNQKPIHNNSRSKVVSYLNIFDEIRELFARTKKAKENKYTASFFSPNIKDGRCEICKGQGEIKVEMTFLEDLYILCEDCNGTGFKENILEVEYEGYNIHQFLNAEIIELMSLFKSQSKIVNTLSILAELGMGYIKLGQVSATLSGGEAQRIKLAKILGESTNKNSLYLLDEPTTGLSIKDSHKLLSVLKDLSINNTIIIIEHNIDFIKACANYLVDFRMKNDSDEGTIGAFGFTPGIYDNDELSFI